MFFNSDSNWQLFPQSPSGLLTGMAQGTTSLLTNTVYAISDAATQFSRVAHKVASHLVITSNVFVDRTVNWLHNFIFRVLLP